jgi:hypothetical protein
MGLLRLQRKDEYFMSTELTRFLDLLSQPIWAVEHDIRQVLRELADSSFLFRGALDCREIVFLCMREIIELPAPVLWVCR